MRNIRRLVLVLAALIVLALPGNARATDLDVTAAVPYDPPTEAAVIASPSNGTSTDNQTLLVSGTCGIIEPAAIVSIWRGNQSLGSTTCMSGGIFSLSVQLINGSNQLVARTSNISLQYGPDSSPISVTYAAKASPTITGSTTASTPASDLSITSEHTFRVITSENSEVILRIAVDGGKTPYTIVVTWGDGSQDTRIADEAGTYEFRHTYDKVQTYRVVINLTDVLGSTTSYTLPVVSSTVAPTSVGSNTILTTSQKQDDHAWWWVIATGIVLLVAVAFYAGERYRDKTVRAERRELKKQNRRRSKRPALGIGIVILFAAGALVAFYLWMVQPSSVVVESPNLITVAGATDKTETIETPYYSANIPESLSKKSSTENPNGSVLSQALYTHTKSTITDQLAITVGVAESNSVRDLSAVQARQQDPSTYQVSTTPEAPSGSITYVKNVDGKYERGVYWIKDGRYAMVVVSSTTDRIPELNTAIGTVLRTWQWQSR